MKRLVAFVLVGGIGLGAGLLLRGSSPQPSTRLFSEQAKAQAIEAGMGQLGGGRVAHTFKDETELKAFAGLWQQRQAHVIRSAMLEGYWNSEQASLAQINDQLKTQYSLDAEKGYVLNTDRKAILERPAPPAEAGADAATAPAKAPAAEEEGTIVHTFTDDAAMQAFAQLWQQRQSSLVRMAVLKSYWESEKALKDKLDAALVADYQMDATKQYTLDERQRVLIELNTPPPAVPAAAAPPAVQAPDAPPVQPQAQ